MPTPLSLRFSTGPQVAKSAAVLEQASKRAGTRITNMSEAAKILEASFVADAGAAVKDGKVTADEQGLLTADAFFAAGAQGLSKGGSEVSFETSVSVNMDAKGKWWAQFNSTCNKAPPTVDSVLAGVAAQHPSGSSASVAAQLAKQAELNGYRTLKLGSPFYVLKSGDNLTQVARDLVSQAYLQKAASSLTESTAPWLAAGAKWPDGTLVNVADEKAFLRQCGSWSAYLTYPRFSMNVAKENKAQIEAGIPAALTAILSKNNIPDPNYVQRDGVLAIPNSAELAASGIVP